MRIFQARDAAHLSAGSLKALGLGLPGCGSGVTDPARRTAWSAAAQPGSLVLSRAHWHAINGSYGTSSCHAVVAANERHRDN